MNRDSNTRSLWQDSIAEKNLAAAKATEISFDVIIIGAGITGLTTALLLQQSGRNCLILEAESIGFGTSSGTTAHLNTILDTTYADIAKNFGSSGAALVAKATRKAISMIRNNIETLSVDCDFTTCDGYMYAANGDEAGLLHSIADATRQAGIQAQFTSDFPGPMPFVEAVCIPGQARFNPVKYLIALANAFADAGGKIYEGQRVVKVEESGSVQLVATQEQTYTAEAVVHATHTPMGINIMSFRLAPYRSYVIAAELEEEHMYPECLIYDMQDPYHYYRTAVSEGRKMLIAGGNDHKTGHEMNTEAVFRDLEAYVRQYYPVKKVHYRWSSQYYDSTDGLPYIGQFPGGNSQEYVATGFSGNGMILGTISGKIITDLILTGESQYAGIFSPSRIKPVAGFKNFVKENADVVKHFIADRLSRTDINELSALAGEEGAIVHYQQNKIALYKDAQGALFAVQPVCTHAGCIVQWNSSERSWDCPCHGARYRPDGTILNGPATRPLQKIDLDD